MNKGNGMTESTVRSDWTRGEIEALFALPFNDLLDRAHQTHRAFWPDANTVQLSTLLSVKTGGCPEDCGYCSQSSHYETDIGASKLMGCAEVLEIARQARDAGASRFCMSAAWRDLKDRDLPKVAQLVSEVKALGLETCLTAGMLKDGQAEALRDAGLDYYNHNLDTSPEYYERIISTRTYEDRLNTLQSVRAAGMKVCSGGIIGMGEEVADRAGLLHQFAIMAPHPDSLPINKLVPIAGTPLGEVERIDDLEVVRMIAAARVVLPRTYVRLSAGRTSMPEAVQAMCFFAGANSIFYGDRLLTTDNPEHAADRALFDKLGIKAETLEERLAPLDGHACTHEHHGKTVEATPAE